MKSFILSLLLPLMLGLIPAPVDFRPARGTSGVDRVVVRKPSRALKKATAELPEFSRKEAYRLRIGPRKAVIEAYTPEGVFRARKSLEQLQALGKVPCGVILDYPRFRHRGLMIDESRSFKGLDFLKKQIDAMALLKFNVLHLHLDDSAGWRIESEAYPLLTEKTAWRVGQLYWDWEKSGYRFLDKDDPNAYGGCYSAAELRELVAYAAERYITIIPEIEMPGHSMEVTWAYPEVACQLEDGTRFKGGWDLCPGSEDTYKLLEAVLTEVMDIFPGEYIHIGGDEASMAVWPKCVNCRALMEREGYTEVGQLQGYLVRRIDEFVRSKGRHIIGWDEILETGVPEEAVVQSWRGISGGQKATAAGHKVVMSPNSHVYFDYYQDLIRKEPPACGELTSLRHVYSYEPVAPGMDESLVLGLQANLWCEWVPTCEHAEYMLWPRAFAVAETGWSPAGSKDPDAFRKRALAMQDVLRAMGYNTFDLRTETNLARSGYRTFEAYKAAGFEDPTGIPAEE